MGGVGQKTICARPHGLAKFRKANLMAQRMKARCFKRICFFSKTFEAEEGENAMGPRLGSTGAM